MTLPDQYKWLLNENHPLIVEALKYYGTHEVEGDGDNPTIMQWAKELGISWYQHDATPWCGLFMGIVTKRAGDPFDPNKLLSALLWAQYGGEPQQATLGDILVFKRTGGGHVALYVGEDSEAYHILGGNQADQVDITRISKERLYAVRTSVRFAHYSPLTKTVLSSSGALSQNEA